MRPPSRACFSKGHKRSKIPFLLIEHLGGGHTGDVSTLLLVPRVVDMCRGRLSPLTGKPIHVVAAGGIYDGRGLAAALSMGAEAVW